ncbi:nickel pincer cofactor biosynthesis protein LarB [Roseimaritima ulvae]|nr:nickel pincer cofactor biosynthesis protein LarB [Roseimaritima ulvae]
MPSSNSSNAPPEHLLRLFQMVAAGQLTADDATLQAAAGGFGPHAMAPIEGATVDVGRVQRCGFGEVIYGEGKSAALITEIARRLLPQQREVLVTRCESQVAEQVANDFACHRYDDVARTLRLSESPLDAPSLEASSETSSANGSRVAVVCAGSTDLPVAREAAETLAWMGIRVDRIDDIGVAGPQRLLAVVDRLRLARAIVVVAGMEGALPSAVAGHVAVPVVAVPTSVGYGASLGGWTALLGMLTSCASNVSVVNIDAGFKGGYVAGLIASQGDPAC